MNSMYVVFEDFHLLILQGQNFEEINALVRFLLFIRELARFVLKGNFLRNLGISPLITTIPSL